MPGITIEQVFRRLEWLESRVQDAELEIANLKREHELLLPQLNYDDWDEVIDDQIYEQDESYDSTVEPGSPGIQVPKNDP